MWKRVRGWRGRKSRRMERREAEWEEGKNTSLKDHTVYARF
jgi:hypothetical protein